MPDPKAVVAHSGLIDTSIKLVTTQPVAADFTGNVIAFNPADGDLADRVLYGKTTIGSGAGNIFALGHIPRRTTTVPNGNNNNPRFAGEFILFADNTNGWGIWRYSGSAWALVSQHPGIVTTVPSGTPQYDGQTAIYITATPSGGTPGHATFRAISSVWRLIDQNPATSTPPNRPSTPAFLGQLFYTLAAARAVLWLAETASVWRAIGSPGWYNAINPVTGSIVPDHLGQPFFDSRDEGLGGQKFYVANGTGAGNWKAIN